MSDIAEALRGLAFFARFSVSFTRPGLQARKLLWAQENHDLSGQTWLVTGATGGIGRAAVLGALAGGATVLAVARSAEKLQQLRQDSDGLPGQLEIRQVDLSLKSDVARLAQQVLAQGPVIDVLVNNVGILNNHRQQTVEGHEQSYATNLLNQHLLARTLLSGDGLSDAGAVINVVSGGLYTSNRNLVRLDQPQQGFDGVAAYAAHKRGQLALIDHYRDHYPGAGRRFYAMHPGWVDTAGVQTSLPGFRAVFGPILRNAAEGADTILWLGASRPKDQADRVWFDRGIRQAHYFRATRQADASIDELVAYLDKDLADTDIPGHDE